MVPILPLGDAIDSILELLNVNSTVLTANNTGKLYLAGLALLFHLQNDSARIQAILNTHDDEVDVLKPPPFEDIPAIAAILQNASLFQTLLQCLSTTPEADGHGNGNTEPTNLPGSRKRTLSIGGESHNGPPYNKAMKSSNLSPVPNRVKLDAVNNSPKPAMNTQVLVTTILYAALRHLDHWPAPLVKAYCDDCFAGRKWVDLKECQLLVQNLALVHSPITEHNGDKLSFNAKEADAVAAAYQKISESRYTSATSTMRRQNSTSSSTGSNSNALPAPTESKEVMEDSDSSSGEEENEQEMERTPSKRDKKANQLEGLVYYPERHPIRNFEAVRQRYFGSNQDLAHELVVQSLSDRLDAKSKQSSGLLLALPSFVCIPGVRRLAAKNLERWLQSPALAGLGRTLFNSVVTSMKNVDPPLPADLEAVESIVTMQLKSNQLGSHVENVVAAVKGVPNVAIVRAMYSKLLAGFIDRAEDIDRGNADQLKMIVAIHRNVPEQMSYECLAASISRLLVPDSGTPPLIAFKENSMLEQLCATIRSFAAELGPAFNGCTLFDSLMSVNRDNVATSSVEDENKARVMCHCLVMHARYSPSTHHKLYVNTKTKLLFWCCTRYGPGFNTKMLRKMKVLDCATEFGGQMLPAPNYRTIFDSAANDQLPAFFSAMRCILFLEDAASRSMRQFHTATYKDDRDLEAVRKCCALLSPVNDEMVWIVVRSCSLSRGGLSREIGIQMLEHLFENCGRRRVSSLHLTNPMLVWELYNLAQYDLPNLSATDSKPQLALSSMWWRSTILSLVMCASSTESIGTIMWKENPTLRCIIKMVTSYRFRFPTIDCDEVTRVETKTAEQHARDLEASIAESIFLPPAETIAVSEEKQMGSRTSTRLRKKEVETRLAREVSERKRRKALLRTAQKSIMLWDPVGPARKPPKEAAELLLSVEKLFDLSATFQSSTQPDFLLMTLGGTDRGAIERAYDWLLPIISKIPTTISRLPSSASCFLLLRAYGSNGQTELKVLSSPLLHHVIACLRGAFGGDEAVKALRLLLQDLASTEPEKRRCARRVLQASLKRHESESNNDPDSWLLEILELKHASSVIQESIQLMASAAALERGRNLRSLLLALERFVEFAQANLIDPVVRLPQLAIELMTTKPGVVAEAMDSFSELRSWTLRMIIFQFDEEVKRGKAAENEQGRGHLKVATGSDTCLTLRTLQGVSILLSVWKEEYNTTLSVDRAIIDRLINALLGRPSERSADVSLLPTAEYRMPTEIWIMLAKARSDVIARLAALSAPVAILPRLMLSSGLSKASLATMIDRLGQLGDSSDDKEETYLKLLESIASSERGIGQLGERRSLTFNLHSRISAYIRLLPLNDGFLVPFSTTFLKWLDNHCATRVPTPSKVKQKKLQKAGTQIGRSEVSQILANLTKTSTPEDIEYELFASKAMLEPSIKFKLPNAWEQCANDRVNLDKLASADEQLEELVKSSDREAALAKAIQFTRSSCTEKGSEKALAQKWLPLLPIATNCPELWVELFRSSDNDETTELLDLLAEKCAIYWDKGQIQACLKWIASAVSQPSKSCFERMVTFVVASAGCGDLYPTPPRFSVLASKTALNVDYGLFHGLVNLALGTAIKADNFKSNCPWLILLRLLASSSQNREQNISNNVLERIPTATECHQRVLHGVLLSLYVYCPNWVNVDVPSTQMKLIKAVSMYPEYTEWASSTTSGTFNNSLCSLASDGGVRSGRGLLELARKYPLLLLAKCSAMVYLLKADASVHPHRGTVRDGRVQGEGLQDSREALFDSRTVIVKVRHWGYAYTEVLWLALLDALTTVPSNVLFTCGVSVGLLNVLTTYVQLLSVQLRLRTPDRAARLTAKLSEVSRTFRSSAPSGWKRWLSEVVEGTEMRHMLMGLELITPQDAIESIQSTQDDEALQE
ncbi:hypothetical protein MPSEU_000792600 [Mayamaea pseudoterrestris]|nr:hypothetical protein MPSEU_000792600 [Mayamaea pseudoterrestris]